MRVPYRIITNFIPIFIIEDELHARAAERVPRPVSDNRREVPGGVQVGFRSFLKVFGLRVRVRMAINMATNERVAVKILNEKIE